MTENQFSTYSYRRAEPVIAHVGHDIGDVECMIIGIDFDHEMFQLIPIDFDLFEDEPFWYHFKFVDKKFKKPKMKVIYGSADVKPKRKDNEND